MAWNKTGEKKNPGTKNAPK